MFNMYNILSTFIIPMKGISKQTSDLLLFSLNILFIHKNTGGVHAPRVKFGLLCPKPKALDRIDYDKLL